MRQIKKVNLARRSEEVFACAVEKIVERQNQGHRSTAKSPPSELLIVYRHICGRESQTVPDETCDDRMSRVEDYFSEISRSAFRRRIQKNHQQHAQAQRGCGKTDQPRPFPFPKFS